MSDFADGFIRSGLIKKTNVQSKRIRKSNRDMGDMAHMLGTAVAQKIKAEEEAATNDELRQEIGRLRSEIAEFDLSLDKFIAHHAAQKAQSDYLMSELDRICEEQEIVNPARIPAYKDPDTLRIPSGDRKGQAMTSADHAYIVAFANKFVERFAKKWTHIKDWKDFLHGRISY